MDFETIIINRLIDKYEDRSPNSKRRVRIICGRKEIAVPENDDNEYRIFLDAVYRLRTMELIEFDWQKREHIINSIWLNLEKVEQAYDFVNRKDRKSRIDAVIRIIDRSITETDSEQLYRFLSAEREAIISNRRLMGVFGIEVKILSRVFAALINIYRLNGRTVSIRDFSTEVFGIPDMFEDALPHTAELLRQIEPELRNQEHLSDKETLAYMGVIAEREIYEFCGKVKLIFKDGAVDFSPMTSGAAVPDSCLEGVEGVEIADTDRIVLFISKDNYYEYCTDKPERELAVYHGTFCTPQKKRFLSMLCRSSLLPVYFSDSSDDPIPSYCGNY